MTYDLPPPMRHTNLGPKNICEICGKRRGGPNPINHDKCSRIRKAQGFEHGREPR